MLLLSILTRKRNDQFQFIEQNITPRQTIKKSVGVIFVFCVAFIPLRTVEDACPYKEKLNFLTRTTLFRVIFLSSVLAFAYNGIDFNIDIGEMIMAIKIFIDQGHNPTNPNAGAEGNGYREQDLVYPIGRALAALLNANPNFEARTSRNSPDEVLGTSTATSLAARVNAANDWNADAFISLHANASNIISASGSEAFVYSLNSTALPLAEDILIGLSDATGLANRGVFPRPTLYVLRKTKMPALLLEIGFITNGGDARLMAENPNLIARGIYNGILRYYGF